MDILFNELINYNNLKYFSYENNLLSDDKMRKIKINEKKLEEYNKIDIESDAYKEKKNQIEIDLDRLKTDKIFIDSNDIDLTSINIFRGNEVVKNSNIDIELIIENKFFNNLDINKKNKIIKKLITLQNDMLLLFPIIGTKDKNKNIVRDNATFNNNLKQRFINAANTFESPNIIVNIYLDKKPIPTDSKNKEFQDISSDEQDKISDFFYDDEDLKDVFTELNDLSAKDITYNGLIDEYYCELEYSKIFKKIKDKKLLSKYLACEHLLRIKKIILYNKHPDIKKIHKISDNFDSYKRKIIKDMIIKLKEEGYESTDIWNMLDKELL